MISVLVPTRGRPESMRRLMDSIRYTAAGSVEVVFYIDDDDPESQKMGEWWMDFGRRGEGQNQLHTRSIVGPRILLSEAWNTCSRHAAHDIMMHCGDDIVFRTPGWDRIIIKAFDATPDRIALVWGRDGIEDRPSHGFLHRNWVDTVGYFVPPYFASDYNDTWLAWVAHAIGRSVFVPDVYTEHLHFTVGKHPLDATHEERLARHREQDCDKIWRETAHLRERDAQSLRAVINR